MPEETNKQEIVDAEHLRLLRLGYFIAAATNAIWILFPLIYAGMGTVVLWDAFGGGPQNPSPPTALGIALVAFGLTFSLAAAALTVLKLFVAQAIADRKSRTLILVTAAIMCLAVPWGTAVGVLTFVVMTRPSIAARFQPAA